MTLLLTESFDWLATADLPDGYGAFSEFVGPYGKDSESIATARTDNGYKVIATTGAAGTRPYYISGISLPINVTAGATVICGFAVKFSHIPTWGTMAFAGIPNSGALGDALFNIFLGVTTGGDISAGWSSGGGNWQTYGNCGVSISTGIWYFIELKFVSDGTAGSIEIYINGVQKLNLSSQDTLLNDDSYSGLVLGNHNYLTDYETIFDDVYICDTNGSYNNDFLGDIQVQVLEPNGNGNSSQFTGSDADSTDNYLHLDETPDPDDDTSYVEDNTQNNKDTYAYENTTSLDSVKAVNVKTIGKKTGVGGPDLKAVARHSTSETDSSALGLSVDYTCQPAIYETNPSTASVWTPSEVDAAEFGIKVA